MLGLYVIFTIGANDVSVRKLWGFIVESIIFVQWDFQRTEQYSVAAR